MKHLGTLKFVTKIAFTLAAIRALSNFPDFSVPIASLVVLAIEYVLYKLFISI